MSRNAQLRTIYSKNQDAVTSLNSHYEASKQLLEQLKGDVNWLRSELKKGECARKSLQSPH